MGRKYIWVEFCVKIFTYLIYVKNYFGKSHVSEKWPKKLKKKPDKGPKLKKKPKKPKKAQNFKRAKKATKSPNSFGSFSSGLFKTNFGVHGHFFLLSQ